MENSRTINTAKNASFGLISQILNIILSFISRTIFIYILGVEYLGINGLFTNILMLLSFAELGIGNAIIYGMYKPLAVNDKERLKSLMDLYKKSYTIIALIVFIGGLLVIPFMDIIIKETPNIKENIVLIYILFLLNTSISYLYVYKKSIITADQKNYIVLFYQQVFMTIQILAQIIFLWVTGDYVIFLIIQILTTLINNLYVSNKADKMYPYLKEGTTKKLNKKDTVSLFNDVKALFFYKIGSVILNGTDSIILSSMFGIVAVGINSNYLLIIAAVTAIIGQIMNGFTASVGNLNATATKETQERVFDKIFFLSTWVYGFCSVALLLFLNKLIILWVGDSFIFSDVIVSAIVLHFYINGVHFTAYTYRVTMGLFIQGRWAPLAAAFLNIVLSLWLGSTIGVVGIFLATSIARLVTTGIVDPILVYKIGFDKSSISYFLRYFFFISLFTIIYLFLRKVMSIITISGVFGLLLEIIIVTLIFNLIMTIIFWRNKNFVEIRKTFLSLYKKHKN